MDNDKDLQDRIKRYKNTLKTADAVDIEDAFNDLLAKLAEMFFIKGFEVGMDFIITKEVLIK